MTQRLGPAGNGLSGAFLVVPIWLWTILGLNNAAWAQGPERYYIQEWKDNTHTLAVLREVSAGEFFEVSPADASFNFDNWTGPSDGGRSLPVGRVRIGGDEVGEDLNLVGNTGGHLTGAGSGLVNMSPSGSLFEWTTRYRWYDEDRDLLRETAFRLVLPEGLGAGVGARTRQLDGFWDFLNLSFPDRIFVSEQFSDPLGIELTDLGRSLYAPINVGSSSRFFHNFTTDQEVDTGSTDVTLAWFIRTNVVPAPSVTFCMPLVWISRRRRPV